jgi:hypothetical protein
VFVHLGFQSFNLLAERKTAFAPDVARTAFCRVYKKDAPPVNFAAFFGIRQILTDST